MAIKPQKSNPEIDGRTAEEFNLTPAGFVERLAQLDPWTEETGTLVLVFLDEVKGGGPGPEYTSIRVLSSVFDKKEELVSLLPGIQSGAFQCDGGILAIALTSAGTVAGCRDHKIKWRYAHIALTEILSSRLAPRSFDVVRKALDARFMEAVAAAEAAANELQKKRAAGDETITDAQIGEIASDY